MPAITHRLDIAAPLATVRAAVATPDGIRGWWCRDSDCTDRVGGTHELRFVKGDHRVVMRFRVDRLADDEVQWTCTENGNPVWPGTTLRWRFVPSGDGVVVELEHGGFAEDQSPPFQMTVQGWPHFCASLKAYAETGQGMPS